MPHLRKGLNFPLPQVVSSDLEQMPRPAAWWNALPPCGSELSGKVDLISEEVTAPFLRLFWWNRSALCRGQLDINYFWPVSHLQRGGLICQTEGK